MAWTTPSRNCRSDRLCDSLARRPAGVWRRSGHAYRFESDRCACSVPRCARSRTIRGRMHGYKYVSGHDEPSVLFYSTIPGSGNSNEYRLTLPTDPVAAAEAGRDREHVELPASPGLLARHDHVRRPVRAQSGCRPARPTATRTSSRARTRSRPKYLGLTPGQAYMEMQFYPPGWGPVELHRRNGDPGRQVVLRADDRQRPGELEHRRRRTTRPATTSSARSRSTTRSSRRAASP